MRAVIAGAPPTGVPAPVTGNPHPSTDRIPKVFINFLAYFSRQMFKSGEGLYTFTMFRGKSCSLG